MTLTADEARTALRTAMLAWADDLETLTPKVSPDGAMAQFVARIPPDQPKVFALSYMFVSEDEQRMIELHRRISGYLDAGLPEWVEG